MSPPKMEGEVYLRRGPPGYLTLDIEGTVSKQNTPEDKP